MENLIWESMLDADMNERYWSHLTRRYYNYEKAIQIFLSLSSLGTIISWVIWVRAEFLWKSLSILSAIFAVAVPILNLSKLIESLSVLASKWSIIRSEYEVLWIYCSNKSKGNEELEGLVKKLKRLETKTSRLEVTLPNDKKLLLKCHSEVLKSRDLS
jgi:hypothetical protein